MKKEFYWVFLTVVVFGIGYGLYTFFSEKSSLQTQIPALISEDSQKNNLVELSEDASVKEVSSAAFLIPTIEIAKAKSREANSLSALAGIIPSALIFASNHNNSLLGYVPNETPCGAKPTARLVGSELKDVIVFAKRCYGDFYNCYDAHSTAAVSEKFALNTSNVACDSFKEPLSAFEIRNQQDALGMLIEETPYYDSLVTRVFNGLHEYATKHGGSFRGFLTKDLFEKELSMEYANASGNNDPWTINPTTNSMKHIQLSGNDLLFVTPSQCSTKVHLDIAPDGTDFVTYMPLCEMPQYSVCADAMTPMDHIYITKTHDIQKTYHCNKN